MRTIEIVRQDTSLSRKTTLPLQRCREAIATGGRGKCDGRKRGCHSLSASMAAAYAPCNKVGNQAHMAALTAEMAE